MICAWKELLGILPLWMRNEVDRFGKETLQELRLRLHAPPELRLGSGSIWLERKITADDLKQCVNNASRYSPWNAVTVEQGYLTAPGGHRIGLCGEAVCRGGSMAGIRDVSSLCIRVARDFPGIAGEIGQLDGSLLILGAPGWGKTNWLRDLSRQRSDMGCQTAVVDERRELFPMGDCFFPGKCTDILIGCPKREGISTVLRTMGPDCIAVDEITAEEDCNALLEAGRCGVQLLATAHGTGIREIRNRRIYRELRDGRLFDYVVVMNRDKSWRVERMDR